MGITEIRVIAGIIAVVLVGIIALRRRSAGAKRPAARRR